MFLKIVPAGNAFWELERASAAKNNPQAPTGKKKTIVDDIIVDSYQEEVNYTFLSLPYLFRLDS